MGAEIGALIAGLLFVFGIVPLCLIVVLGLFGVVITYIPALAIVILFNYVVGLIKGTNSISIKKEEKE